MLTKITLVNAAGFAYSEIDLNGNTFLLGENGAGKTTTLRAILYFYTMNASKLGIDRNKKSFAQHYLQDKNSFILYTYKAQKSYITAIAFSQETSGDVRFRFFHSPEKPDLKKYFVQDKKLLDRGAVFDRIGQDFALSNFYSPAEARAIVFGKPKRDKTSLYNLFENGDEKTLGGMLGFVFSNKKIDDVSVKKAVLASIAESFDNYGDLSVLGRDIEAFYQKFLDIKEYKKKEGKIKTLSISILPRYADLVQKLNTSFSEIVCAYERAKESEKSTNQEISTLQEVLKNKLSEKEATEEVFKKQEVYLLSEIKTDEREIERLKAIETKWKQSNIEKKIAEFQELEAKKRIFFDKKEAFEVLTKSIETQKENLKFRKEKLSSDYEKEMARLREALALKKQEKENIADKYKMKISQKLYEISEDADKDKTYLSETLEKKQEELNALFANKRIILDKKFQTDMQTEVEQLESTKKKIEQELQKIVSEVAQKEKELQDLLFTLREEEQKLKKEKEAKLTPLYKKRKEVLLLLDPEKGSILDTVEDSSLFLKFLNTNALVKGNLVKGKKEETKSSIFGLEVDIEALEAPYLDIAAIENDIEQQTKEFNKKELSIKSSFGQKKRLLEESLEAFLKNQQRLNQELTQIKKTIMDLNYKILSAKKEFEKQIAMDLKNKEEEIYLAKQDIKNLKVKITKINQKRDAKKEEAKKTLMGELTKKERKITFEIGDISSQISEKQKELNLELKKMEDEFSKNSLGEKEKILRREISNLESFISRVQGYISEIGIYKNEMKLVSKIDEIEKKLYSGKETLASTRRDFKIQIDEIEKKIRDIRNDIDKQQNMLNHIQKEISAFEQFQALYFQDLENVKAVESCDKPVSFLVTEIAKLKKEVEESEVLIKKTINSLDNIFDNSLQIKRHISYLDTAKELQQYYLKSLVSEMEDLLQSDFAQYKNQIKSIYIKILSLKSEIDKAIRSVNNDLNNPAITVIDSIKIRYISSDNKIVKSLFRVYEAVEESDESSLFGTDESSAGVDALISLAAAIRENEMAKLSPEELFGLEFQVSERGNLSPWSQSLNNIGSEGTDILTKNLIYLSLLKRVKRRYSKRSIRVHLILDEVGKLDSRFLSELIKKANSFGIFYVNASPDKKNVHQYKNVYFLKRGESKKIVAIKQKLVGF